MVRQKEPDYGRASLLWGKTWFFELMYFLIGDKGVSDIREKLASFSGSLTSWTVS